MATAGRKGRRGPRQDDQDLAVSVALGERVRARRAVLGLSQQELGRRVGLTFQQVQKYERGHNRISVPTLVKISSALDTAPATLLDGLGGPAGPAQAETLDRAAMALLGASRKLPEPVRRAMLDLACSVAGMGGDAEAQATVETGETGDTGRSLTPGAAVAPAVETPAPVERRGGSQTDADRPARRRRRGAVWDPSDIWRGTRG